MSGRAAGLLRRGPSLAVLEQQYAKRGRIDRAAPVQAQHTMWIDAPVSLVWLLLADVARWPQWCPLVQELVVDGPELRPGVEFHWRTGRNKIRSRVATLVPEYEISWTGNCSGARAVRRQTVRPGPDGGSQVTVAESMSGLFLTLFYDSDKLQQATGAWLEALRTTAEGWHHDGVSTGRLGRAFPT